MDFTKKIEGRMTVSINKDVPKVYRVENSYDYSKGSKKGKTMTSIEGGGYTCAAKAVSEELLKEYSNIDVKKKGK